MISSGCQLTGVELGPGGRATYRDIFPIEYGDIPGASYSVPGATGSVRHAVNHPAHVYCIEVAGTNISAMNEVIRVLEAHLGLIDLTPKRLQLPDLQSFFDRVRFLFWNYLVRGETEPI